MMRSSLMFIMEPLSVSSSSVPNFDLALYDELGLEHDGPWATVDLDSSLLPDLLRRIVEMKQQGIAGLREGVLRLSIVDDLQEPCEWYMLDRTPLELYAIDIPWLREGLPECKAYQRSSEQDITGTEVSERFKAVMEAAGLRHMQFLWVRDTGKYQAPQWYQPIVTETLGRGLDHPWFDASTLRGSGSFQPDDPKWRHGVWWFTRDQMRTGAGYNDLVKDQLISAFPLRDASGAGHKELRILTYRQVLRKQLPDTDFAAIWRSGNNSLNLCFNRKAKEVLVGHGYVRAKDCQGILVLDELPPGLQDLDALYGKPPPLYDSQALTNAFTRTNLAYAAFLKTPKPKRNMTQAQSLRLLKEAKRTHPDRFAPPAPASAVQAANAALPFPMPKAWQQVLQISNGFWWSGSTFHSAETFSANHVFYQSLVKNTKAFPNHVLHFGTELTGDWYAFDLSTLNAGGDCEVWYVTHEGYREDGKWASVAEFLEDLLTREEDGE